MMKNGGSLSSFSSHLRFVRRSKSCMVIFGALVKCLSDVNVVISSMP